jgi:hypothetical protein
MYGGRERWLSLRSGPWIKSIEKRATSRAAHMVAEVATGAHGVAERPVDIDPEALIRV